MSNPSTIRAADVQAALAGVQEELLAARLPAGHWEGRLSSSALSTATAISAFCLLDRHAKDTSAAGQKRRAGRERCRAAGLAWLAQQQNADGGFGDTDLSHSNIATSMLVSAAVRLSGQPAELADVLDRCETYNAAQGGIAGLRARYGKDKTFAVPILTNCALAGLVDWKQVSSLPFELACFPQSVFRFLKLPVVSYAIPALVAIGQAKYFHRKPRNPFALATRAAAVGKSLQVLERMQPESGGFLEATPLTAFVAMSLASTGQADHPAVRRAEQFLFDSMRADGSWPIDTNLATWNTTLSLNALLPDASDHQTSIQSAAGANCQDLSNLLQQPLLDWLLACQHRTIHPYTGALPGGWAWTDLSGGVPDVDDTSGALLALAKWRDYAAAADERFADSNSARMLDAAQAGLRWLADLQNRDGGWPTFCRGWGTMPFDRSSTDLTAHAIRAMLAWREAVSADEQLVRRIEKAIPRGFAFLSRRQAEDGSWSPLWFGNQDHPAEENPVYGTARVLLAYVDAAQAGRTEFAPETSQKGVHRLASLQNADGGWGGNGRQSSVEETALTVEALSGVIGSRLAGLLPAAKLHLAQGGEWLTAWQHGIRWLMQAIRENCHKKPSPIGFYFAKLWYYEDSYPLIFTAAALRSALAAQTSTSQLSTAQHDPASNQQDASPTQKHNASPRAVASATI